MPNIKSAKKRVLVSKANYEHNKAYRSALRTAVKKADAAIEANSADMAEVVTAAVKKIDQAAVKGIIHKNNAARKKSALVTRFNKVNCKSTRNAFAFRVLFYVKKPDRSA